uniref:Uncharacterized protein n=1 Tax=Arundo donax TaxID=35708 RepID=A0A0A9B5W6_ARUDO
MRDCKRGRRTWKSPRGRGREAVALVGFARGSQLRPYMWGKEEEVLGLPSVRGMDRASVGGSFCVLPLKSGLGVEERSRLEMP